MMTSPICCGLVNLPDGSIRIFCGPTRFIAKVAVGPDPIVPAAVVREREREETPPPAHNGSSPVLERKVSEACTTPVLPSESSSPPLPAENIGHEKPAPAARKRLLVLLAGLVLVAALLTAAAVWLHDWPPVERPASVARGFHSIAVLPFVNLAQNSDQDYIVDGMTDQLITDLASSTPLPCHLP